MGAGSASNALSGFWEPILHTKWPCPTLMQEKVLLQLDMLGFVFLIDFY